MGGHYPSYRRFKVVLFQAKLHLLKRVYCVPAIVYTIRFYQGILTTLILVVSQAILKTRSIPGQNNCIEFVSRIILQAMHNPSQQDHT